MPDHVTIEPVADGVWAALHRAGGWAVGNAGIVDLGGATLLFDACLTPQAFAEVVAASRELTGREPTYLALSHFHNDHVRGAQLLPDVPLLATRRTRALLDTLGRDELESDLEHAEAQAELARAMRDDAEPVKRAAGTYFVPYWEGLAASASQITLRLPDVTFEESLELHGSRRSAVVRSLGPSHTGDDAILYVPDAGVVFCGDLLFVRAHPYLADGDPDGLDRALEELARLPAARFVPGHGPVGGHDEVAAMQRHLAGLRETAQRLVADGAAPDVIEALLPVGDARTWEFAFPFYRANVRYLVRRASAASVAPVAAGS
jgi:cyclase